MGRARAERFFSGRGQREFWVFKCQRETVEEFWKKGDTKGVDIEAEIEEMRLNSDRPCSSDYGPIRNVRDLEVPNLKTIKSIIAERYKLLGAIFEKEKKRK